MPSFQVLEPIKYNGRRYAPGETITIDARTTAELRPYGVLGGQVAASGHHTREGADDLNQDLTALPEDFPARPALEAAGRATVESLDGLTADDLTEIKGIGPATAKAILAARDEMKA